MEDGTITILNVLSRKFKGQQFPVFLYSFIPFLDVSPALMNWLNGKPPNRW